MGDREKRLARERVAADWIQKNHGPMADLFEDVARDIGAELVGLPKATRTARMAAEMAYRLDEMTDLSGFSPLAEALDFFGYFLGSLIFLAIVDGIEAAAKRKKERVGRLKKRLEDKGPRMAKLARTRLERRIKRLEAK
jgi:hypothetical protein